MNWQKPAFNVFMDTMDFMRLGHKWSSQKNSHGNCDERLGLPED